MAASCSHLCAPNGSRSSHAARRGRLRDHVERAVPKNEVEIAVVLGADERNGSGDSLDMPLEGETRVRECSRRWPCNEKADRRRPHRQQSRSVLKRFTDQRSIPQRSRVPDAVPASAAVVENAAVTTRSMAAQTVLTPIIILHSLK
jgi:hypothetical protein